MLDTSPLPPTRAGPGAARRPYPWAVELLEILTLRRWILAGVAVAVGLAGAVVAAFLPEVLPPRPLAGAAVGVAAYFVGLAAAIAADAADPTVRGRRHVEATGAVIAASISGFTPNLELVAWVEHLIREHKGLRIAVTATGSDAPGSGQLADELGVSLARRGLHVLVTNLEKTNEEWPGASEVCGGQVKLSEVVEFHPSLQLARLGPGRDRTRALSEFTMLSSSLPLDVDVLVLALPGLGCVGTLPALAAVDRALLLAASDVTSRVELLAALKSVDEIRMPTDVVLVHGLPSVESGLSVADPIDLWSEAMTPVAEPIDAWRGEMVTIVAPPRQEGVGSLQQSAADTGVAPQAADRGPQAEWQSAPWASDSTGEFAEPAKWELSTSPQKGAPRGSGASGPVAPRATVQPPPGERSRHDQATSRETSPARQARGRTIDADAQRDAVKSNSEGVAFEDSETGLRLAAWLDRPSSEEAEGR